MIIRRNGSDLIVEFTLINKNTGIGVTSGATATVSIQRMSDTNYWVGPATNSFSSATEGALHVLAHIREGLYAFTLIGGAENVERSYRIHLVVTGAPAVNTDATFSDVIISVPLTAAEVNTEVDTALSDIFLDQLFAIAYNSASPDGVTDSFLNEITEDDLGLTRFTANALELGPGGGLTVASIVDGVWDETIAGDHDLVGSSGKLLQDIESITSQITFDANSNVDSNIASIGGSLTVDTLPITTLFENLISYIQGGVVRVGNTYSYKKQNGTTTTFSYTTSATGRT